MPNWCNNHLELQHEDATMISRAVTAFNNGTLLNEFIPVPDELQIPAGSVGAKDSPEQIAHELLEKQNREKHGYANWWDFCVAEWGTKWDVGSEHFGISADPSGKSLIASFDSAWSPPIAAYTKLEELGFTVKAMYYEGGMLFAGVYSNGCDDYFEFSDSKEAREILPEELDDMFCISESMEEWEEQE